MSTRVMQIRGKILIPLLLVFFVGAPAVALLAILGAPKGPASEGSQPGGSVRGVVHDALGSTVPNARVEGFLAHWRSPGDRPGLLRKPGARIEPALELAHTATSDAQGRFALELPPHEGFYVLRARTPTTIGQDVHFSFLDGSSRGAEGARAAEPVTLSLRAGAKLVIVLRDADDEANSIEGNYSVHTAPGSGFLRIPEPQLLGAGAFSGSRIELESLPLSRATIEVALRGGRAFEAQLDLQAGENVVELP